MRRSGRQSGPSASGAAGSSCASRRIRRAEGSPTVPGAPALSRPAARARRALVVARLDRLARSLNEAARLLERAKREGWNLVALDLGLDLSTPEGEQVANAFVSVAQWERRLSSERTREALARTRAQGVKLGTPRTTPAPAVAKISKLRAQGLSLQATADELNRLRVPTTRGGSKWRPSSVRSVLVRTS